ncbi:hypothetical protein IYQ92_06960 [Streptococcus sp. HF-1907]|uniref:hypothetical protein n=1 Tax=Streptococcus sp. HF-1907 TaxID=2785793 RepID=UPI00189D3779|nr:hypothetical protein [Streptococcus sp. HF-1907]MBF7094980.1 hypothetical protein [Streptococcus sp. HF-1907]
MRTRQFLYASVAVLTLASLSLVQAVRAEDTTSAPTTVMTQVSNLTIKQRDSKSIVDIAMSLSAPVKEATPMTVTLSDTSGNKIDSLTHKMTTGSSSFTAWFDLTNRPEGLYLVSVEPEMADAKIDPMTQTFTYTKPVAAKTDETKTETKPSSEATATETPKEGQKQTEITKTTDTTTQPTYENRTITGISAQIRSDNSAVDVPVTFDQAMSKDTKILVKLTDDNLKLLSSFVYTMPKGNKFFTAWFSLKNLPVGTYHVSVFPDYNETTVFEHRKVNVFHKTAYVAPKTNQTTSASSSAKTSQATTPTQPARQQKNVLPKTSSENSVAMTVLGWVTFGLAGLLANHFYNNKHREG